MEEGRREHGKKGRRDEGGKKFWMQEGGRIRKKVCIREIEREKGRKEKERSCGWGIIRMTNIKMEV